MLLEGDRGQSGHELAQRISTGSPGPGIGVFDSVARALDEARRAAKEDELILVFGSFRTVAQAMRTASQRVVTELRSPGG